NVIYTPPTNFTGTVTINYTITDPSNATASATITVTVLLNNRAPVANADSYTLGKNTSLNGSAPGALSNDTDLDGDSLTAVVATGPTNGTLNLLANGSFTYTPASNYFGSDSFTYRANDGLANSGLATVSLSITNINRAPVATADSYTLGKNT